MRAYNAQKESTRAADGRMGGVRLPTPVYLDARVRVTDAVS